MKCKYGLAIQDHRLATCDVVVDPLGYHAPLFAAAAPGASRAVWQGAQGPDPIETAEKGLRKTVCS